MNLKKILASALLLGLVIIPAVSQATTMDSVLASLSQKIAQLSLAISNLKTSQLGAVTLASLPSVSNITIDLGADNVWVAGTAHNVGWTASNFTNYPDIPTVSLTICNLAGTICYPWSGVIGNPADEQIAYNLGTISRQMGPRLYQRLHDGERMGLLSIFSGQSEPFQAKIRICPTYGQGVYGVRAGAPTNLNSCSFSQVFKVGNPNETSSNLVKAFPVLNPSTDWVITGPMRSLTWNKDAFPGAAYVEIWMCPASASAYSDAACVRSYTGSDAPNTGSRMIGLPYNDTRLVPGAWKIFVRGLAAGTNDGADFSANINLVKTENDVSGATWSPWSACEVKTCGLILNQTRTCTGAACTVRQEKRVCGYVPCARTNKHLSAQFDSWDLPDKMAVGEDKLITVKMKNTGDIPWPNQSMMDSSATSSQYAFRLAIVEPSNYDADKTWSSSGSLSLIDYVSPGGIGTFTGTIKATTTPGIYKLAFQMYQRGAALGLFGNKTKTKHINVGDYVVPKAPDPELVVSGTNAKSGDFVTLTDRDGGYQVRVIGPVKGCYINSGRIPQASTNNKSLFTIDTDTNTYLLKSKEDAKYPYDFFPKKSGLSEDTVNLICPDYSPKSVVVKVKPTIKSFSASRSGSNIVYKWKTSSGAKSDAPDGTLTCTIRQNNKYYETNGTPNPNDPSASNETTLNNVSNNQGGSEDKQQSKSVAGPCKANNITVRQYCAIDAYISCTSKNGLSSNEAHATYNLDLRNSY